MSPKFTIATALVLAASCSAFSSKAKLGARQATSGAEIYQFPLASTNVLHPVLPPSQFNFSTPFLPPNVTLEQAKSTPFHVYHPDFYNIIGQNPTLTVIVSTPGYAAAHEAPVYSPATDSFFWVSNAGGNLGFSGLNATNAVFRLNVTEAKTKAFTDRSLNSTSGNYMGQNVTIERINSPNNTDLENVNGGTNYLGQLVFMTQGRGDTLPPTITLVNPRAPYNSSVILNNYFGRQYNSLNDVVYHRGTGDLFFTDPDYGNVQGFRPSPGLPGQVYRWNPSTGLVSVVADQFSRPNGIAFSPDESIAYVCDTGLFGIDRDPVRPATIYAYDVDGNGNFHNRRTFAYASNGIPDGIHCDTNGNVYTGTFEGVYVYNPAGILLGKIFVGSTTANFQWVGDNAMIILAEQQIYLATFAANGDPVWTKS